MKIENWIFNLYPIIEEYKKNHRFIPEAIDESFEDEPLDGDEVDDLCKIIKAEINLHQGNITDNEYEKIINILK